MLSDQTQSGDCRCPICGAGRARFYAGGRDRLLGVAPGVFRLLRCTSCRCIFQDPLPDPAEISAFYPEAYWGSEAGHARLGIPGMLDRLEQFYREWVVADHIRFLERCARGREPGELDLLDVGCGSGLLLHVARNRGFNSHGMDVSRRAVELARGEYGLDVRCGSIGDDIWDGRRFDFITMFHVLEHLTDPRAALRYAAGLLKPGGSLILQVPNVSSLQARCFAVNWHGLDVPRHIINFTPEAFERLLADSGFVIRNRARFSLRDNPPAIASSIAPGLDPIARRQPGKQSSSWIRAGLESVYLGLVLLSLPFALAESAIGLGGTIWVQAKPRD